MALTVGTIRLESGHVGKALWRISAEPHILMRLRRWWPRVSEVPGAITINATDEVCRDLEMITTRWAFDIDKLAARFLSQEARSFDNRVEQFKVLLEAGRTDELFQLALPPREYQALASQLWVQQKGLLVADELGLGKTMVAIAAITRPELRPAVVVCPTHLIEQWQREFAKFAPQIFTHVIKTRTPYKLEWKMLRKEIRAWTDRLDALGLDCDFDLGKVRPQVLILPYSRVQGWGDHLAGQARSIVFDEVQELRRTESMKSQACLAIGSQCEFRLGLSATPISNLGGEMIHILEQLIPGALGSVDEFHREWCTSWGQGKWPLSDAKAFGRYLRDHGYMIRRTRKDVARELPPLTTITHRVDTGGCALRDVESKAAELARILLSEASSFHDRGVAARELDWRLRQATGIAKANYVAAFVRMLVEQGQKVLLSGWHRAVYDMWMHELEKFNPVMYTGTETPRMKQRAVDRFVNDDDCRVFIMSLRSGAGLNDLQRVCQTVVHGELDWTFAAHEQLTGRIDRDGQLLPTFEYFLVSEDGSDPSVAATLGLKRAQLEGIRSPEKSSLQQRTADPNHMKKLAAAYLEGRK